MARHRRRSRRSRSRRRSRRPAGAGASRRGTALVPMIVGTVLGAGAALGSAALLDTAAKAAKFELPQVVKDFAPIAGAGVVYALAMLAPKFKILATPAVIGGVAVVALNMLLAKRAPQSAGAYNRLRGAGNVARVLNSGAGNVARVLNATAVVR